MAVDDHGDTAARPTPVSQTEALRGWVSRERAKRGQDPNVADLAATDVVAELLAYKPGAASFVWRDSPLRWYRTRLDRDQFDRLHVVEGPSDLGWRALAPEGSVRRVAENLAAREVGDGETKTRTPAIDAEYISELRGDPERRTDEPLVVNTRRGHVPLFVADGNHRAVAAALDLHHGGPYEPFTAYVAVGSNPILTPVRQRVRGFVDRVRARAATSRLASLVPTADEARGGVR